MTIIPRKVFTMNDIRNKKVVQHNDLITSVAKMDKTPLKIFEMAVACLDTENIPEDRTVYISKNALFSFFDVKSEAKHTRMKESLMKVHEQAIFHMTQQVEEDKFDMKIISPIEETCWNNYNDTVSIQFTSKIMPYLIELKNNFTQYLISDISTLSSKYSIIIYKWLSMNYNQYEYYQNKSNRREEQLEKLRNPIITVQELRRITDTEKEYSRFPHFEERVLKKAKEEISKSTNFFVSYEKIKKGRSIDSIQFHITKKSSVPNETYKEEQQDSVYLKNKELKKQTQQELFMEAMQSKYTTLLMENMLIGYKDMQTIETMASLQKIVYPIYDELKKLRGLDGVKTHLSYVSSKQEGYSKQNIVKYLKTAIENYLVTVKLQNKTND